MNKTNENDFFDIDTERYSWDDIKGKIQKETEKTWSVLYGNGMSMTFNKECFSYANLSDRVREQDPEVTELLDNVIKNDNLEEALLKISEATKVAKSVQCEELFQCLEEKYKSVQESFIKAVNSLHPDFKSNSQRDKLHDFISSFGKVFTTNYDLITYWAMSKKFDNFTDFFSRKNNENLEFDSERSAPTHVYYLHGALHLINKDYIYYGQTIKISSKNSSDSSEVLLNSISKIIKSGSTPLFVAEGDSILKERRIQTNSYLRFCFNSLQTCKATSILIFGHSLSSSDAHLFNAILQNKNITDIWYGIHITDPAKKEDEINKKIEELEENAQEAVEIHGRGKLPPKKNLHIYIANDLSEWLTNP